MKYLKICILVFVVFTSCSKYEKLLKSDNYSVKYQRALEYYSQEKWIKAAGLFENITSFYRGAQQIDTINYFNAMCNFHMSDYLLAGYLFKTNYEMYPNSVFAEDSRYMNAYCFYLSSPKPGLDQEYTLRSIEEFQLYLENYPNSPKYIEVQKYIVELREKLIQKSFNSAKLYFDLQEFKASVIALNNSLVKFPDTKYREEILFLILKSSYLLAEKSIDTKKKERYQNTVDAYYSFIDEYPKSTFANDAKKIYEKSQEKIQ